MGYLDGGGWFLPALFWANTLFYLISKWINNIKISLPFHYVIGVFGMILRSHNFDIPFGIARGLSMMPFMVAGVIINISIFYNGHVNFRSNLFLTNICNHAQYFAIIRQSILMI